MLMYLKQDSPCTASAEIDVKRAVARLTDEENLIGDGSQQCALPTIRGKHSDLRTITADTVCTTRTDDIIIIMLLMFFSLSVSFFNLPHRNG